jgi:hypothetical protein
MVDVVIDTGPGEGAITDLYVWIATWSDGTETIIGRDMPVPEMPGLMRHMPLMNSRPEIAEKLAPLAQEMRRATMHRDKRIVSVRLQHFFTTESTPA